MEPKKEPDLKRKRLPHILPATESNVGLHVDGSTEGKDSNEDAGSLPCKRRKGSDEAATIAIKHMFLVGMVKADSTLQLHLTWGKEEKCWFKVSWQFPQHKEVSVVMEQDQINYILFCTNNETNEKVIFLDFRLHQEIVSKGLFENGSGAYTTPQIAFILQDDKKWPELVAFLLNNGLGEEMDHRRLREKLKRYSRMKSPRPGDPKLRKGERENEGEDDDDDEEEGDNEEGKEEEEGIAEEQKEEEGEEEGKGGVDDADCPPLRNGTSEVDSNVPQLTSMSEVATQTEDRRGPDSKAQWEEMERRLHDQVGKYIDELDHFQSSTLDVEASTTRRLTFQEIEATFKRVTKARNDWRKEEEDALDKLSKAYQMEREKRMKKLMEFMNSTPSNLYRLIDCIHHSRTEAKVASNLMVLKVKKSS